MPAPTAPGGVGGGGGGPPTFPTRSAGGLEGRQVVPAHAAHRQQAGGRREHRAPGLQHRRAQHLGRKQLQSVGTSRQRRKAFTGRGHAGHRQQAARPGLAHHRSIEVGRQHQAATGVGHAVDIGCAQHRAGPHQHAVAPGAGQALDAVERRRGIEWHLDHPHAAAVQRGGHVQHLGRHHAAQDGDHALQLVGVHQASSTRPAATARRHCPRVVASASAVFTPMPARPSAIA
jgi:hypothetical protein